MNISFSMTQQQIRLRQKWVTRRNGWGALEPGQILNACEKCQGLGKGGKIVVMGQIQVVDVRKERLDRMLEDTNYGYAECMAEGFPNMTPLEFVDFFCKGHKGITPASIVTRIQFIYI